jgi:hypothetical protein
MSGIAVIGSAEATVGLVPRYLRAREHSATPAWAPGDDNSEASTQVAMGGLAAANPVVLTMTEEMRKRIADVSKPEKRRIRPMLFGVAAVAAILLAILLFPDSVVALLPDPS